MNQTTQATTSRKIAWMGLNLNLFERLLAAGIIFGWRIWGRMRINIWILGFFCQTSLKNLSNGKFCSTRWETIASDELKSTIANREKEKRPVFTDTSWLSASGSQDVLMSRKVKHKGKWELTLEAAVLRVSDTSSSHTLHLTAAWPSLNVHVAELLSFTDDEIFTFL